MIIYFSGTGNSAMVARGLHRRYYPEDAAGEKLYELSGARLLRPGNELLKIEDNELVIWVFPVHSWGVPPMVARFIDKVKCLNGEHGRHYMVCTCGDDIGRADDQWREHIGHRSWIPRGAFSVQMPNTYVCMKGFDVDSKELADSKLAAMDGRLDEICMKIDRGFSDSDVVRGSWAWLKTNLVFPWFITFKMSPLPFKADPELCTRCGLCARACPLENITMEEAENTTSNTENEGDSKPLPKWGPACMMCLRCYHHCPAHAVKYGRHTDGKGQYRPQ